VIGLEMRIGKSSYGCYHGEDNCLCVNKGLKGQLVSEISTVQWNKVALDVWCWMREDIKVYIAQSGYKALLEEDVSIHFDRCGEVWDLNIPDRKGIWLASIDG